jgi:hypothetical protein
MTRIHRAPAPAHLANFEFEEILKIEQILNLEKYEFEQKIKSKQ